MLKKNKIEKKKIDLIINIVIIILFVLICVPFFVTIKYALFCTDDYSLANAMVGETDNGYIIPAIECAIRYWHVKGGMWFAYICAYAWNPLVHHGYVSLVRGLRVVLAVTIVSALFFCYALSSLFDLKKESIAKVIAIVFFPVLLFKEYNELYLWWTGSDYLVSLIVMLIGCGFIVMALKTGSNVYYVIAIMFLILMSGSDLNVVGVGCYFVLILVIGWSFYQKKIEPRAVVAFGITLAGACINAFAPGNFIRYNDQDVEGINIFQSLYNTILILGVETKWMILHTAFVAFLCLAFWFGIKLEKKISFKNMICSIILISFVPFISLFPVVLGYGATSYKLIPNRVYGILDIYLIFTAVYIFVVLGVYVSSVVAVKRKLSKIIGILAISLLLVQTIICGRSFVPVQIANNLLNGSIEKYHDVWVDIYSECEQNPGKDLVIEKEVPKRVTGCSRPNLKEDKTDWKNEHLSAYYGLQSVSLVDLSDE